MNTQYFSKKVLLLFLILILFYAFQFKFLERSIFNIQFVDEDDNFVTGEWISKGQILYKDIFFQHQPSATYISSIVQEMTKPNSIYLLIKRHRELVYVYCALAFLLLTFRIGFACFMAAIIYETTKFHLFGNLFLSEALSIPPLIFVISLIHEKVAMNEKLSNKMDLSVALISIIFIQFTLLPLLPFAIVSFFIIWYLSVKSLKKFILYFLVAYIIFLIFIFLKIFPLYQYLRDTVFITSVHNASSEIEHLGSFILRLFLYPVLAINFENAGFFLVFKTLCVIFLASVIILIKRKFYLVAVLCVSLFWLSNLRPAPFNLFYGGFHLLPMYAALLWLTLLNINFLVLRSHKKIYKIVGFSLLIPIILFSLFSYKKEISSQFDRENNFYANYSPKFDYGEAIKLLSKSDDKMLVGTSESLIYWQSKLLSSSPFFFTYGYMYKSEKLKAEIANSFSEDLPEFFYFNGDFEKDLIYGVRANNYLPVLLRGKPSRLYILKSKLNDITEDQWASSNKLGFSEK